MPPHVVTLSSLFPSSMQPGAGLFVRERAFRVGQRMPLCVVSPVPWFPLQGLIRRFRPGFRPGAPAYEKAKGRGRVVPAVSCHCQVCSSTGTAGSWRWAPIRACVRSRRRGRLDLIDAHFGYPDGFAAAKLARWLGRPLHRHPCAAPNPAMQLIRRCAHA